MKIPFKFSVSLFAIAALSVAAVLPDENNRKMHISRYENVLGTSLELKIESTSEEAAGRAENAALDEIERLDKILSGYDKQSEFSQWLQTKGTAVKVSGELYEVLDLFARWKERTGGALDPSAEIVSKVWREAAAKNQLPSSQVLAEAVAKVKESHYVLDPVTHTATHLDNAPLMLNSFAKSYVISKATAAGTSISGVSSMIVNIGGDLVISGEHTEQIAISDPLADAENDAPISRLLVSNKAVATSGNYRRGEEINGKWYSHIVDPRTGEPAGNIISATVVAPNAADAGALATAFNVLRPVESQRLASTVKGAEYLIVTKSGKHYQSNGWAALEMPALKTDEAVVSKSKENLWDVRYELVINLEIARIEGARTHAPYVAVWITDKDKNTVRNIALWYAKPRWLSDLTTWNKANGTTFLAENSSISSISSATRSAGKYALKWDGKDDKGNLVKAGSYTVNIEAAREHGTYQLITKEMSFNGKASQIALDGNVEIASATLDYRKK